MNASLKFGVSSKYKAGKEEADQQLVHLGMSNEMSSAS